MLRKKDPTYTTLQFFPRPQPLGRRGTRPSMQIILNFRPINGCGSADAVYPIDRPRDPNDSESFAVGPTSFNAGEPTPFIIWLYPGGDGAEVDLTVTHASRGIAAGTFLFDIFAGVALRFGVTHLATLVLSDKRVMRASLDRYDEAEE